MEKKITKREKFEMLKEIIRGDVNVEMTVEQAELIEFLDAQIVAIDTKAEKAKARNAEKKANVNTKIGGLMFLAILECIGILAILGWWLQ